MTKELVPAGGLLPGLVENETANEIDAMIDRFIADIDPDRVPDALPRLPSKDERLAIETRRRTLLKKLEPVKASMVSGDKVMEKLGELWCRYPSLRQADVSGMGAAYYLDLEDSPLFAVLAAIEDVRRNRVKGLDLDWPPSSGRILDRAQQHVVPVARAKMAAERVLAVTKIIPVDNPAFAERAREDALAWLQAHRIEADDREERIREDLCRHMAGTSERMIRDEYRALGREPVQSKGFTFSPSLLRSLGQKI